MAATKLVLMPLTRSVMKKKGDLKAAHSIENLAGVVGLFLTFTVALQMGSLEA